MPRRRVHAGIILVGFVVASGLAMACLIFAALSVGGHHVTAADASSSRTSAPPTTSATPTTTTTATSKPTFAKTPGTAKSPGATTIAPLPPLAAASSATVTPTSVVPTNNGANQRDVPDPVAAGDCVAGVGSGGSVAKTSCGSSDSIYRVNSTASASGRCPSDSDRSVSVTLPGGAKDTLCLDTDWEVGRCMAVKGNSATPADCSAPVPGTMRVQAINRNTADVNTCSDSGHGVVYKQRKFVVCLAQM
ncbi:LppU/SCO3897 family protein [Nocardia macrotermitis]|uniref:Uncharacterized protein n=1 Tax=Nocardia macrotermitis TaxID=2585198 RepID=A0A7K0CWE3_9NOCA|nr:hypothetical protein [Nocardia macrotermitis]MQY17819.1 hypothetical protein [Nocardia macrotermitis]